ncbi:TonB-dependent receptor [Balneolales bacterium ANBcel1]|nr:TonB-dependent receptor [Balneolales bacterium ANBcel1]
MNNYKSILLFLVAAVFFGAVNADAQTVRGTVVDAETGESLIGVNIMLHGTNIGTTTGMEGDFTLNVPDLEGTLVFRYVGFVTQRVSIDGRERIDIDLEPDVIYGDELIVVGYGLQQRSLVTGAISRIEASDIEQAAPLRVEQALQGRTAGVTVMQNSGQPGSGATVRIRGIGTTGDAEPLYVVDGMPVGGIDYLNPADIASIEVLKDASATAIYGARGANGVVMITTQQGSPGPLQVNYTGYVGFQNPWRETNLLDAPDYMKIMNESYANDGRAIPFPDIDDRVAEIGSGTNWQDEVFYYNAPVTDHTLRLSGGTETSTYMASMSYRHQDGIVAQGKSKFERMSFRVNSNHKRGRLEYGTRLTYTNKTTRGIDPNEEFGGIMSRVANIDPVTPVYDEDGNFAGSPFASQEVVNPVAAIEIINSEWKEDKFVGGLFGNFNFSDRLSLRSTLDLDLAYGNTRSFNPIYNLGGNVSNSTTSATQEQNKWITWQTSHVLRFQDQISDHNFSVLAGFELLDYRNEYLGGVAYDLTMESFDHSWLSVGTDEENQANWGGLGLESLASYFGRVNYDYNNRYMLEGVLRFDGSSKFGPDDRWGMFPAVSVGWVISREDFLRDNDYISYLKLRAGWGQNGSDNIGQFSYTPLITTHAGYGFGMDPSVVTGAYPAQIANPNLRWETSEQISIGLETAFLDHRLYFNFDVYNKETKGLLLAAPIPAFIGNAPPTVNGGTVRNRGFEVESGFRQTFGDWRVNLNLTGTYNSNEMTKIENEEGRLFGAGVSTSMDHVAMAMVGKPIAFFWGYETAGIFQNEAEIQAHVNSEGELIQPNARPGDLIFVDQNDDGQITDEDRVKIGNPYPDFTMGFNIDLSYQNWDLNMFWYGAFGQDIFTGGTRRHDLPMPNWKDDVLDRWTEENPSTSHPRVTIDDPNGNYTRPSDFFVEDGSYVRLRNISLGYTLPPNISSLAGASRLRLYVSAQNLLTFTGYSGHDPEIGSYGALNVGIDRNIYPQARTFTMGINLDF